MKRKRKRKEKKKEIIKEKRIKTVVTDTIKRSRRQQALGLEPSLLTHQHLYDERSSRNSMTS